MQTSESKCSFMETGRKFLKLIFSLLAMLCVCMHAVDSILYTCVMHSIQNILFYFVSKCFDLAKPQMERTVKHMASSNLKSTRSLEQVFCSAVRKYNHKRLGYQGLKNVCFVVQTNPKGCGRILLMYEIPEHSDTGNMEIFNNRKNGRRFDSNAHIC